MSIIGPRPERPHFAVPFAQQIPDYHDRHRVPGGITGTAQVNGLWGNCSLEERVRLDNLYIDDWSLRRDFAILLRTPFAIIRRGRLMSPAPVVTQIHCAVEGTESIQSAPAAS
jgi:lipopolysaccharide/colanic/teichoic acid biosynthesis glycosyltransferase